MSWNLNWANVSEFLAMGGYGLYVWGSFGATALVLIAELWSLAARRRALVRMAVHSTALGQADTDYPNPETS